MFLLAEPEPLGVRFNQAIVAISTVVDRVDVSGIRIDEHEEVMSQQVHVSRRFFW